MQIDVINLNFSKRVSYKNKPHKIIIKILKLILVISSNFSFMRDHINKYKCLPIADIN